MDVMTVASVDLSDACYRLSCVTVEDWNNNSHIIIETWKVLNILCNRFPNVTKGSLTRHEDQIITSPPQAVSQPNDSGCRATSLSSHVTPTRVSNTQPRSTPYGFEPVPGKRFNSTASTSCPQNSCRQRALKSIVHNAQKRQQLLEESDVRTTLSQRVTKYPPARASGDVARAKRHGLDRSMFFLEGFFGAMYITEKYREFQTAELQRREKRNRGKPKNVYDEFATYLGVSGVNFPPITKLGDSLLAIWKSGHYAFLLLIDRRSTLRRMSVDDAESLGQSLGDNSAVTEIIQKQNISIKNAYDRYKQVADESWTVGKMATTKKAIDAIMLAEGSNRDEAPGVADQAPLSGIATPLALDTASSRPTSVEDGDISTPATTPSEHPNSRQSSAPSLEPRNVESVRQVGSQDWISRGNLDGLPTIALHPQTLQEHGFTDSSTTIAHKSSEVDSSANNATCLYVSNTLARKRLHADHQIDTLSPRSAEGSDSMDVLCANSSSDQGQCHLEETVTAEYNLIRSQTRPPRKRRCVHHACGNMLNGRSIESEFNNTRATIVTGTDGPPQPTNYSQQLLEISGSSTPQSHFDPISDPFVAPRSIEIGLVQQDCSMPIPHNTASTGMVTPDTSWQPLDLGDMDMEMIQGWPSREDMEMIQNSLSEEDMEMIQSLLTTFPFEDNSVTH
nr:hypothetical protein LTR18_002309 [Exophiala xenobiotica]